MNWRIGSVELATKGAKTCNVCRLWVAQFVSSACRQSQQALLGARWTSPLPSTGRDAASHQCFRRDYDKHAKEKVSVQARHLPRSNVCMLIERNQRRPSPDLSLSGDLCWCGGGLDAGNGCGASQVSGEQFLDPVHRVLGDL